MQMKIDIEKLTEDELIELNLRIVERCWDCNTESYLRMRVLR